MKKLFLILILAAAIILPMTAQESEKKEIWDHGDNVSSITYQNISIYRIYDQSDSYVLLYAKQGAKVGQLVVPKSWAKESPRKLYVRSMAPDLDPYATVIKQDGEFLKVWLTIPTNRFHKVWGVAPKNMKVNSDIDKLDVAF